MSIGHDVEEWVARNWDESMTLAQWWAALAEAGWSQPTWPEGLGGRGLRAGEAREVTAALGAAGVIGPPSGNGPNMGGPTVLAHGTDDQKQRFVRPLATGRHAWCQLFSEPGAGSDLAGLSCRAVADGDEFVITGQKVWNSAADVSEWGMLLARTDPDRPKHQGISYLMIDMRQPGIEIRPLVQMNGDAEFCEVFLTEARARRADVIGDLNDGWNVARTTLTFERASAGSGRSRGLVPARAGGLGGMLDRQVGDIVAAARDTAANPRAVREVLLSSRSMIALARDRGRTDDPVIRQAVIDYHIQSEVYRLTNQRGRDNAKSGRPGPEGSTAKLALAMMAHRARDVSLAITGAAGMLDGESSFDGGRVVHAALSSPMPSLGGGTNEIQRNIIAERSLGLPKEPATDQGVPFRDIVKN